MIPREGGAIPVQSLRGESCLCRGSHSQRYGGVVCVHVCVCAGCVEGEEPAKVPMRAKPRKWLSSAFRPEGPTQKTTGQHIWQFLFHLNHSPCWPCLGYSETASQEWQRPGIQSEASVCWVRSLQGFDYCMLLPWK